VGVVFRWARLCLPWVLVVGCTFDTKGFDVGDAGASGDGSIRRSDAGTSDGGTGDGGTRDAANPSDAGAGDARDAGPGDAAGDSTTCLPQCSGRPCGASDGCTGTCQAGSGCCTPVCDAPVCGGNDGCGGTCHGNNGDDCDAEEETWRCVWIDNYDAWGSQVCRDDEWQTFALNPRTCQACCGGFSPDCCAASGC
jgi:hypothetical protein